MAGTLADKYCRFIKVPLSLHWLNPSLQHRDMGDHGGSWGHTVGIFHRAFPSQWRCGWANALDECWRRLEELALNTWNSHVGELLSIVGSILCHEVGMWSSCKAGNQLCDSGDQSSVSCQIIPDSQSVAFWSTIFTSHFPVGVWTELIY